MLAKLIMGYWHRFFKPVPATFQPVSNYTLRKILREQHNPEIFISDSKYQIPRHEDIKKFLKIHIFKFRQYVPEKYDCDNYAFSLMGMFTNLMSGYAIGIVWADTPNGKHALNFYIGLGKYGKPTFYYIEPQTNRVFQNKDYNPYFIVI